MREELIKYKGKTLKLSALIGRYGSDINNKPTLCLTDVQTLSGDYLSCHMWIKMKPNMGGFDKGAVVTFTAKIISYKKPPERFDGEPIVDYRLSGVRAFKAILGAKYKALVRGKLIKE